MTNTATATNQATDAESVVTRYLDAWNAAPDTPDRSPNCGASAQNAAPDATVRGLR